jgi:serine/threonine protein kinase
MTFGQSAGRNIDKEQLQATRDLSTNGGLEKRLKARLNWSDEETRVFAALLDAMLQVSPEERASASQLLCHPFFGTGTPYSSQQRGEWKWSASPEEE